MDPVVPSTVLAVLQIILQLARKGSDAASSVDGLQQRMDAIHRDYMTSFQQLRQHMRSRTTPPAGIIAFLEERRADLEAERQVSKDLARYLGESPKKSMPEGRKNDVEEYCHAVLDYFKCGSSIAGLSWYGDYVNSVRVHVERPRPGRDVWTVNTITEDAAAVLLNEIDDIVTKHLPAKFGRVSTSYARFRAGLL